MAGEVDAVHVERLALLPVERGPQLGQRRAARIVLGHRDLEANAKAVLQRSQLIADLEARLIFAPTLADQWRDRWPSSP